jgi:DNA mismatch repair ATPase MutS
VYLLFFLFYFLFFILFYSSVLVVVVKVHRYRPPSIALLHEQLLQSRESISIVAQSVWIQVLKIVDVHLYAALRDFSTIVGTFDALNSLAIVSKFPGYVKPSFQTTDGSLVVDGSTMVVRGAKHPTMCSEMVANDIKLSQDGGSQNIVSTGI